MHSKLLRSVGNKTVVDVMNKILEADDSKCSRRGIIWHSASANLIQNTKWIFVVIERTEAWSSYGVM